MLSVARADQDGVIANLANYIRRKLKFPPSGRSRQIADGCDLCHSRLSEIRTGKIYAPDIASGVADVAVCNCTAAGIPNYSYV